MLDALISRTTDDVNLVDEVPLALRAEHALLAELADRYKLSITHFQSHYLPAGWSDQLHSVGKFGQLTAMRIDPLDVLAGKLFSKRTKDLDDLRQAWPLIDQARFRDRLKSSTASLASEPQLNEAARKNWYIITGENDPPL